MENSLENAGFDALSGGDTRGMLTHLLSEAQRTLLDDPAGAEYCIEQAASLLARGDKAEAPQTPTFIQGGLAPWQARRVAAIVDSDLESGISVPRLAAAVRLSPSYFRRAFRQTFGSAPHAYILRRRVDRAKELMLKTDEGLADIALACGLGDQSHLPRVFRQIEADTPNAWRRRHYQP